MIDLANLKLALQVVHDEDDSLLAIYLAGAAESARQYVDDPTGDLPDTPAVDLALILLVRSQYSAAVEDMEAFRTAAKRFLAPYRQGLGA